MLQKSTSHAACEHQDCCKDEEESIAFRCDPCTDYLLVADQMVVVEIRTAPVQDGSSDLGWYLPMVVDGYFLHLTALMVHPPSSPMIESLADLAGTFVLL